MSIVQIAKNAPDKDLLNETVPNQVKTNNEIILTNNWKFPFKNITTKFNDT